ncbi:MAG: thioredoxin family protein [Dehalococcoidales bacterium]|jgi:small redox-active disulfide protein 2|nr:thioredoxin family protein [Dehalococcoidales bacterium]
MEIKILGPGCYRCQQLDKMTREVVKELGIDTNIEDIKDIRKIAEYRILATPGLVINGKLACFGRIPTRAEVTQFITTALIREGETSK